MASGTSKKWLGVGAGTVGAAAFAITLFSQANPREPLAADTSAYDLTAGWAEPKGEKAENIKGWTLTELNALKLVSSSERDPGDGKVVRWKGVLLSTLVDAALSSVPAEKKAQIDLVVLKNDQGGQALIPRAFLVKYPMLLAFRREKAILAPPIGPLYSVVPWTSNTKIGTEGVPLESFFMTQVKRIEFANYRERFGDFFLKRRTDPGAMRGEKLFVQNCITCHASGQAPSVSKLSLGERRHEVLSATGSHPNVKGAPKLTDRDRRSLESYLDAYQAENGGNATAGARSALHQQASVN